MTPEKALVAIATRVFEAAERDPTFMRLLYFAGLESEPLAPMFFKRRVSGTIGRWPRWSGSGSAAAWCAGPWTRGSSRGASCPASASSSSSPHLRRQTPVDRRRPGVPDRVDVPPGREGVRCASWVAVAAALLGAGCRSYSAESVDALYREVLQYDGRTTPPAAKLPSETVWKGVEARQLLTLADAYRITLAQGEQVARAAEGFLQSPRGPGPNRRLDPARLDVQGTQFLPDRVPGVVHVGCHDDVLHHRQLALLLTQPLASR